MDNMSSTHPASANGVSPKPTLKNLVTDLSANFAVRLPEWEGFWFRAGGEVLVYTKEGHIMNTPFIEEFGDREDWEAVNFRKETELLQSFFKTLRRRTDTIQNKLDTLLPKNREVALASTALQLGFMWMGKMLGELGNPTPYPKASDPTSSVIEKHADKDIPEELFVAFGDLDHIGIIKGLRKEVELTRDIVRASESWSTNMMLSPNAYPSQMAVDKSLSECIMWLGQQLHNIKVQQDAEKES